MNRIASVLLVALVALTPATLSAQSATGRYLQRTANNAESLLRLSSAVQDLPGPQPFLLNEIVRTIQNTFGPALIQVRTYAVLYGVDLPTSAGAAAGLGGREEILARLHREIETAAVVHTEQAQNGNVAEMQTFAGDLAVEVRSLLDRWREMEGYN